MIFSYMLSYLFILANMIWSFAQSSDSEVTMNVTDIIRFYEYPCELHRVTTDDGYILSLQRIPYGLKNNTQQKRPVVILQHGLLDSSFTWVNNGPDKSLGFILADHGFDVWLGNIRGNVYSNQHTKYSSKSNSFWDFTWDDMAQYDLPAMIDYVLSVTKSKQLGYVGHSQGSEIAFAKLSKKSDLNQKISSFVALAPAVYLGNLKTAIKYLAGLSGGMNFLMNLLGSGEFLPTNELTSAMGKFVCSDKLTSVLCGNVMFLITGFGARNLNYTRMPIYMSHTPAGTSSKNMAHYAQSYLSNKFQMYDYGLVKNLKEYQNIYPPKFDLNTHGVPVAVFWGGNDWLTTPEDVKRTIKELGDDVKLNKYIREYNHIDFIWGIDAATVIYPETIRFLFDYNL